MGIESVLKISLLACIFLGHAVVAVAADQDMSDKPLIEAGLSGGAGFVPDYPASDQGQFRYLAFPVFHLRGKIFRSDDEDGSRARLLKATSIAFELSGSGSFPASSDDNRARAGMDDLQWLGELGPRIFAILYSDEYTTLRTSLAARVAFSTDFMAGYYRGLTLSPGLALDRKQVGSPYLTITARVTPQFASRELQAYYYEVPEHDQLPYRSAYGAKAGYIGTSVTSAFWYEKPTHGIFMGVSVSLHDGAANQQSPLFRERTTLAGFAGFRWYFYRSDARGYL